MSTKHPDQLQQVQEDALDVSLAAARMLTTGPRRHSLDEVLARFGYSREQLHDVPDLQPTRLQKVTRKTKRRKR